MMSSTSDQYDAKKFYLCCPWDTTPPRRGEPRRVSNRRVERLRVDAPPHRRMQARAWVNAAQVQRGLLE